MVSAASTLLAIYLSPDQGAGAMHCGPMPCPFLVQTRRMHEANEMIVRRTSASVDPTIPKTNPDSSFPGM